MKFQSDMKKLQKWQLGTVFFPDSLGYLIGTNFFGGLAHKLGFRFLTILAMALVGVCSFSVSSLETDMKVGENHFNFCR
jgi:MFS transporter, DHA1 family, solute carrier family 18 (vesicular amine transporter), member 1/2